MQTEGSYFDVLGVPVSIIAMPEALRRIEEWSQDRLGRFVCIREVASLMAIRQDPTSAPLHQDAAMITPDGMPLVIIGKLLGKPVERVCGPDLMDEMMRRSVHSGLKHYFYGGKEGVAEALAHRFMQKYPGLQVVGWDCPPFRTLTGSEHEGEIEKIANSGADVVWVGLSSPKQDVWMWHNFRCLPQTLIGVGAAFDFHTGQVRRAPRWMQKACLEWFYRLMQEPRRLYKRYLIQAPKFIGLILLSTISPRAR